MLYILNTILPHHYAIRWRTQKAANQPPLCPDCIITLWYSTMANAICSWIISKYVNALFTPATLTDSRQTWGFIRLHRTLTFSKRAHTDKHTHTYIYIHAVNAHMYKQLSQSATQQKHLFEHSFWLSNRILTA